MKTLPSSSSALRVCVYIYTWHISLQLSWNSYLSLSFSEIFFLLHYENGDILLPGFRRVRVGGCSDGAEQEQQRSNQYNTSFQFIQEQLPSCLFSHDGYNNHNNLTHSSSLDLIHTRSHSISCITITVLCLNFVKLDLIWAYFE